MPCGSQRCDAITVCPALSFEVALRSRLSRGISAQPRPGAAEHGADGRRGAGHGLSAARELVTNSPSDHRAVTRQVAEEADRLLGGEHSCLLINESSCVKKGKDT